MKVRMTSFGLPHNDGSESHDAFEVKSWDETVIAVLADGAGPLPARAKRRNERCALLSIIMKPDPHWTPQKALSEFTRAINRTLHLESLSRFGTPELITTLTVVVVEGDRLIGLNVGDSRVYLIHNGRVVSFRATMSPNALDFRTS